MRYILFITLFVLAYSFGWYAHLVHAQSITGASALILLNPKYPSAGTTVEATIAILNVDLKKSNITWIKNGSIVLRGIGASSFRFTTGAIGATERLEAIIKTPSGEEITAKKEFLLGDIDLLWKADTTIPPEYKGKALPSPFSLITVTAIPHFAKGGRASASDNLTFEWFAGGTRDASASGLGKNTFHVIAGASPGQHLITVSIKSEEQNISFEKSVVIPVREPEVLLYEERPLEGPFMNSALSQITVGGRDAKIFRAVPYYFPRGDAVSFSYEWTQNSEKKETSPAYLFALEAKEGRQTVTIGITIKNLLRTTQKALNKLIIYVQ